MSRKYRGGYKPKSFKGEIPFPYVVFNEKKEVVFRFVSGFPATCAVSPIMKENFPKDYKGVIASPEYWEKIKHLQKNKDKMDS